MKPIKFILLASWIAIVLILCSGLYNVYLISFDEYDSFLIDNIDEDEIEERLDGIVNLLDSNGLSFFIVNESGTENTELTIEIYCSSTDVMRKLKDDYRIEGEFRSIFSAPIKIQFGKSIMDFCKSPNMNEEATVYILNSVADYSELPYQGEYLAENIEGAGGENFYLLFIRILQGVLATLLLFLSLCESHFLAKTYAIKILNGYDAGVLLCKNIIEELVGITIAAIIPALALHSVISSVPMGKWVLVGAIITIFLDILILSLPILKISVRKVFGNANNHGRVIFFCYLLQVLFTVLLVFAGTLLWKTWQNYWKIQRFDELMQLYRGCHQIQVDSTEWSDALCEQVENNSLIVESFVLLKDENGIDYTAVYLNEKAKPLFQYMIGEESIPDTECVYIPQTFTGELVNPLDDNDYSEYRYTPSNSTQYLEYSKETDVPLMPYYFIEHGALILYYTPDAFSLNARAVTENVPFFYEGDPSGLPGLISDYDIYQGYTNYVLKQKIYTFIILIVFLTLLLGQIAIKIVTVGLEFSLHADEICVRRITGSKMFERYENFFLVQIISHVFSTIIVLAVAEELAFGRIQIVLVGGMVFALTAVISMVMIARQERKNLIRILKGGAL